jgi:hypothetical protein
MENYIRYLVTNYRVANKLDWIMPIDMKSDMMKNMPEGMAGACQVTWEKDEEDEDEKTNTT